MQEIKALTTQTTMRIQPPVRTGHVYTQHLDDDPDEIFPLLCPVRETEWVRGWDPETVISESGLAEMGCVFTTVDEFGTSTWFVSVYDRDDHHIEFVKFTPRYFVVLVSIRLRSIEPGRTAAECRYQYTAVGQAGRDFVAGYTGAKYLEFMREWESELNHFLRTGMKLDE